MVEKIQQHQLMLRYDGRQVRDGMDPYVFAEAVKGFADLTQLLHQSTHGDSPMQLRIERTGEPGSWLVEFLMSLDEGTIAVVSGTLVLLAKEVFKLIRHLKGQPPKSREVTGQGKVKIENHQGKVEVFNVQAENILLQQNGSNAADKFVRLPLESQATDVSVEFDGEQAVKVNRKESRVFVPLRSEEELIENRYENWLTIIAPVLQGEGMWRFTDGSRTFTATVEDETFLKAVHEGREAFANGDNLLEQILLNPGHILQRRSSLCIGLV